MNDKLTVERLIQDLQNCNPNNGVCVVVNGTGITIPITDLMNLTTSKEDYTLLIIQKENVELALGIYPDSDSVN